MLNIPRVKANKRKRVSHESPNLDRDDRIMRYRYENFGGVIASESPPFLAFVDREFMRGLGLEDSPLWENPDARIGLLTAPTEVHFAATNACLSNCTHCYMNSGVRESDELDTKDIISGLDVLASLGVFHVALGGGEALYRDDLFQIASHARTVGLIPNLTISGSGLSKDIAKRMRIFGQVNVSIDGVGPVYYTFREKPGFEAAKQALEWLVESNVPAGINCVVGRDNFEGIEEVFHLAADTGANEIEFLRLKPVGRAARDFDLKKTLPTQNNRLIQFLHECEERYDVPAKIDCSFLPLLVDADPPRELLERLAAYGCEAGNVLLGVRSDGLVSGCSFLEPGALSIHDLKNGWHKDSSLTTCRNFVKTAPEPCRSCDFLDICKGGCRAVALFVTGDWRGLDPDCPRVIRWKIEKADA